MRAYLFELHIFFMLPCNKSLAYLIFLLMCLAGSCKLPNQAKMIQQVETKQREMGEQYLTSRRHTLQVSVKPEKKKDLKNYL